MSIKLNASRILKGAACFILVAGIIMQIFMLVEINGVNKEHNKTETEIINMTAERDNMKLRLAGFERTTWIEQRAIELGMQWPTDTQLRVIAVPREYHNATTHTAEITGSR